jgi:hypothetical protein
MVWARFRNENETKGRHPSGIPTARWEQYVRKDVTQKEEHGRKMRRIFGKIKRWTGFVAR